MPPIRIDPSKEERVSLNNLEAPAAILAEITRVRYDLTHLAAIKFVDLVERAEKTSVLSIKRIDEELFQDAKSIFRKYDTPVLSFTDCTSFAICQMYKISEAFAFDQHFTMMGITLLS
jgi:predicted nucleic acid-binding protein